MGVPWGIVAYPADHDAEELNREWRALAAVPMRREFSILRGDHRHDFRRLTTRTPDGNFDVAISVTADPELARKVADLSCGDGTYDRFEQLFDGTEVFVPWRTLAGTISAPGCPVDGKSRDGVDDLIARMRHKLERFKTEPPGDPYVTKLARELLAAARVAKKHRLLLEISF